MLNPDQITEDCVLLVTFPGRAPIRVVAVERDGHAVSGVHELNDFDLGPMGYQHRATCAFESTPAGWVCLSFWGMRCSLECLIEPGYGPTARGISAY